MQFSLFDSSTMLFEWKTWALKLRALFDALLTNYIEHLLWTTSTPLKRCEKRTEMCACVCVRRWSTIASWCQLEVGAQVARGGSAPRNESTLATHHSIGGCFGFQTYSVEILQPVGESVSCAIDAACHKISCATKYRIFVVRFKFSFSVVHKISRKFSVMWHIYSDCVVIFIWF